MSLQTSIAICNRKSRQNFVAFWEKPELYLLKSCHARLFVFFWINWPKYLSKWTSSETEYPWWKLYQNNLDTWFSVEHKHFLNFNLFELNFFAQRASVLWFELTLCWVFAKFVVVLITRAAPAPSQWTQLLPPDIAVNKLSCAGERWDKLNTSAVPTLIELQDVQTWLLRFFFQFARFEMNS